MSFVWKARCAGCGFACDFSDVPGIAPSLMREALVEEVQVLHGTKACSRRLSLEMVEVDPASSLPS
jgi:hypothetical protein